MSLLQQLLQGGLLERLHRVDSDKHTQKLQVKQPIVEMNDVAWDELVKNGLCIHVRFSNTTLKIGNNSVIVQDVGVRYWNGDFKQVFGDSLKQTLKMDLPGSCHKVTVCGDKVFAPIIDKNVVQVYNQQAQLQDTIAIEGKPVCMEKSHVGDMLVCCYDTGLFLLKEDSKEPVNIATGTYSDMCMYGDKVYTWDYRNKQIVKFVREKMEWKRQEMGVNVGMGGSECDTLLVRQCEGDNTGVEFFVSLWSQHTILRVSEEGKQISQYGDRNGQGEGRLQHPFVCAVDSDGHILVAEWNNYKYKVLNTNIGVWRTVFTGDNYVYDAKVENENTVWFSRYSEGKYVITRHEFAHSLWLYRTTGNNKQTEK